MDTHTALDNNNPINFNEFVETCRHCQTDLEDGVCELCDKCIYCGEMLNECDCTDG